MPDFFVSYNRHDRTWAEWIAWQLEEDGFSVVIQAWDLTGNWIDAMDRAMRESERTIAVLSPHYLEALYTRSEWADAFRRDPTGERDLLVPVKVALLELSGILAQIVYVDLVDIAEDEARRRLLARAHGQRGKPSVPPGFPGGGAPRVVHDAVARRPPYPAAQEDTEQFRVARELLVGWRGQYVARVQELRALAVQARGWSRELPATFDDAVDRTIVVAAEVAEAMGRLPVAKLEFARAYGLQVHETVFWGQALDAARHEREQFDAATRATSARLSDEWRRHGLGAPNSSPTPDQYGFEMLARVLESAVGLLDYDLRWLPRGFVSAPASAPSAAPDLRGKRGLLLARVDDEPGLRLITADHEPATIASFTARSLPLLVRVAQHNRDGSLDLVAEDTQHRYYFAGSSPVPTAQYPARSSALDARFLSDVPGGPAVLVLADGSVETIDGGGASATLRGQNDSQDLENSPRLWIDPLDAAVRRVVSVNRWTLDVTSAALDGSQEATRPGAELWRDPAFDVAETETSAAVLRAHPEFDSVYWSGVTLTLATLQGLDCVLARGATITRRARVQFLDPRSLAALRRPLSVSGAEREMTIAGGRWLVVALRHDEPCRLAVWDLASKSDQPLTLAYSEPGEVYEPLVVSESSTGFRTVQVFRTLNVYPAPNRFELLAFDGPAGSARPLQVFKSLRLWPVREALSERA